VARNAEVKVRIRGDSKSAEQAAKKTESAFVRMGSAIKRNALAITAAVAGTVIALRGLSRAITGSVSAAFDQERAVRTMNASLKVAGDYSRAASQDMRAFSTELAKVNATTDQAVLRGIALAKAFGATNEQAKLMVSTAHDFAVAADLNFTEALRRIGRATQGSTEDIAKFAPEIANLTREQLAAGEATRILAERFKGLSAELAAGAEGSVKRIGIAFGEMKERVGEAIIENEGVTKSIGEIREVREDQGTIDSVAELAAKMLEVATNTLSAANALRKFAGPTDAITKGLADANEQFKKESEELVSVSVKVVALWDKWKAALLNLLPGMKDTTAEIEKAEAATEALVHAQEREKRILDELDASQDAFLKGTQRLGIVLERDVTEKIAANNRLLEVYKNQLDSNRITSEDFARAQAAIAIANRELRDSLLPATAEVQNLTIAYSSVAPAVNLATAATQRFVTATAAANAALNQFRGDFARQAAERRSRGDDPIQIGGGTFTYFRHSCSTSAAR
jgi:hypothetical protein